MALVARLRGVAAALDGARAAILVVELVVFVAFILYIAWATLSAGQGLCADLGGHPVRRVYIPSSVYVFTAVVAFIAGHILAQVDSAEFIHGHTDDPKLDINARPLAGCVIHAAVALAFFVLMVMMFTEAYTLRIGSWPITYYARCSVEASPVIALLAAAGLCFIGGRWFWVVEWRR